MAMLKRKPIDIPEDAIILSENEALVYNWKIINGWKKTSEVWSMLYAPAILGAMGVASSFWINNHYRRKLKLGNYGRLSSYMPLVVFPAIFTSFTHKAYIQSIIILEKEKCPVCVQTRAAVIQSGFGILYPLILCPLSSMMFATRHFTYRLPSITEKPMEVLKLVQKMTRPITLQVSALVLFNSLLAGFLVFNEYKSMFTIRQNLMELERRLESGVDLSEEQQF